MTSRTSPTGIWVPLITPFRDGTLDENSLRRLIRHYGANGIDGFILAATTGEGQTQSDEELEALVRISADEIASNKLNLPVYLGLSGSNPKKVAAQVKQTGSLPLNGYLVSGPNYLRPSQEGLKRYYELIADATDRNIIVYNIPYRTGANIENDTMLELAKVPNIVGVKDCCGCAEQSYELLRSSPPSFSVLTGEDPFFYNAMVHGAPGAIVTGAHVLADDHLAIMEFVRTGRQRDALTHWNRIAHIPALLFAEPNPAPLKHWLWRQGLIDTSEIRLPFLPVSKTLGDKIDRCIREFEK